MNQTPQTEPLTDAFVAVGSNINQRENIPRALTMLNAHLPIIAISNFYKTAAFGVSGQTDFFNGAVKIKTAFRPRVIKFDILRKIEEELGRVRTADKFAARTIDLDLILCGNMVVDKPGLALPDQAIRSYSFVAVPLFELAPDLLLPDTGAPLSDETVIRCTSELQFLSEFTDYLRRLILG